METFDERQKLNYFPEEEIFILPRSYNPGL